MTKLEKLYSIIENSRDVGVKLPKGALQQVEELNFIVNHGIKYRMGDELDNNE